MLILLDGDAVPARPVRPVDAVPPQDLAAEVENLLGVATLSGYVPANTGGPTVQDLGTILSWAESHVRYLPGMTPEAWLISAAELSDSMDDPKAWWRSHTADYLGKGPGEDVTSTEILVCQKRQLAQLSGESPCASLASFFAPTSTP